jgi:microcin C transport system permease protein
MGASHSRIIFSHIIPNTVSIIVTFMPFTVASGITALTALDYLGFGLPPPTPSWGALLKEGTDSLSHKWIVSSAVGAMVMVLTMVTFIGEAIREAYDPKKFSYYE